MLPKKLQIRILLVGILLIAAGLRFYHLSYKSLSIDEVIGAFYAEEPFERIVIMTINDVHPPLFYMLHHVWIQIFGHSEVGLRGISVLFGVLSVLALYLLGEKIFSRRIGIMAGFMLAVSPWHIWISQNARSNAVLLFLTILSTLSLYELLRSGHKKWHVMYIGLTVLSIYTHYFAFMVWIAQNLFIMSRFVKVKSVMRVWWRSQFIIFFSFLVWLPFMVSQFVTKTRPMYKNLSWEFVKNLYDFLNPFVAGQDLWLTRLGEVIFLALFCMGIFLLIKRTPSVSVVKAEAGTGLRIPPSLRALWILLIAATLVAGFYFKLPKSMPILVKQIQQNASEIYADEIKPYHIEQLQKIPMSFFIAAGVSMLALLAFFRNERRFTEPPESQPTSGANDFSRHSFLAAHMILPLLVAGVISLKSPYLLLRNMVIIFPAYLLVLAVALNYLKPMLRWSGLVICAVFAAISIQHFEQWNIKDDWRSAAHILEQNIQPGDVVLLDHLFPKKPLYYYGLESQSPLRRYEARQFFERVPHDLWIVLSYANEWCVADSSEKYFEKVGEYSFAGSTNQDDLFPINGQLKLLHYHKKDQPIVPAVATLRPTPSPPKQSKIFSDAEQGDFSDLSHFSAKLN